MINFWAKYSSQDLAGSSEAAREAWWQHYIGVKEELVESVLQDMPPDAGGCALDASDDPAVEPRDGQGAAGGAEWGSPRYSSWGRREMRDDIAAAGATGFLGSRHMSGLAELASRIPGIASRCFASVLRET